MKWKKYAALFMLGGGIYVLIELLWRGRSHLAMFGAGGLSFLLVGHQEELKRKPPRWQRCLWGAGIILMVELGFGLLFNRDYHIWDYRGLPGNFCGQICPEYGIAWMLLSLAVGPMYLAAAKRFSPKLQNP